MGRALLLATAIAVCAVPLTVARQQAPGGDEAQARAACGTCHAMPPADVLPRAAWPAAVARMMYIREGRLPPVGRNLPPPGLPADLQQALAYYLARAPERLAAPEPWPDPSESPLAFTRRSMTLPGMDGAPAVSHVRLVDLDRDKKLDVIGTDMAQGVVFSGRLDRPGSTLTEVTVVPHPSHVTIADVDKDGVLDLLVADLGSAFPEDHNKGSAIWMRGTGNGAFSGFWLDGWPRVADVEAADFGGRGWNDLVVAAFGWRKTGRIAIMENRTTNPRQPSFTEHVIDSRTGAIHVIPDDLDKDGRMDFVALLAQEHETVVAYLNRGDFKFEQKVIYQAPHPNWGSTGIDLVDLDKDGDRDVLFTHGDTLDDGIVKPYHGIQWLENKGAYPYAAHAIAGMAGVHRAKAADLDGDGDLDIVASALLAGGSDVDEKTLPALGWVEQVRPGVWAKHAIEIAPPRRATLDIGDIDGDGLPDIVTGMFATGRGASAWVDVWMTRKKQ